MAAVFFDSPVKDVVRAKPCVVDVPETTSVMETLQLLLQNNILSAPVTAPVSLADLSLGEPGHTLLEGPPGPGGLGVGAVEESSAVAKKHYSGVVTILDLAVHLSEQESIEDPEWALRQPILHILKPSNPGLTLMLTDPDASVYDAMDPLSLGARRLLVPLKDGPAPGPRILTQTDIVRFVLDHAPHLEPILLRSVEELGTMRPEVVTCSASMRMADALKCIALSAHDVSALAVVDDETGVIVGQLSASDLRGCTATELLKVSNTPVLQFLASVGNKPRAGGPFLSSFHDTSAVESVVISDRIEKLGPSRAFRTPELVDATGLTRVKDGLAHFRDGLPNHKETDLGANVLAEDETDIGKGEMKGTKSVPRGSYMEGRGDTGNDDVSGADDVVDLQPKGAEEAEEKEVSREEFGDPSKPREEQEAGLREEPKSEVAARLARGRAEKKPSPEEQMNLKKAESDFGERGAGSGKIGAGSGKSGAEEAGEDALEDPQKSRGQQEEEQKSEDGEKSYSSTTTEWGSDVSKSNAEVSSSADSAQNKLLKAVVESQRPLRKGPLSDRSICGSDNKEKDAETIEVELQQGAFENETESEKKATKRGPTDARESLGGPFTGQGCLGGYASVAAMAEMAPSPVTCKADNSLVSVMARALANHVHRVWVVDDNNRPVGVVLFQDIIAASRLYPKDFE